VRHFFEVRQLNKSFGGLKVIVDLDLGLSQGEILSIIGPNGSGKTTLFNLITGFLKTDGGEVRFLGLNITGEKPHQICQHGIARVFQLVQPFAKLTTLQNVMAGRICGERCARNMKEAAREADEILNFVGLSPKREMIAGNLSLPDRKRLEVARALATRPKLLILDEIMAGLNPKETQDAMALLNEIRNSGITLMVVEHIIKAVLGISDRLIVLNAGRKIAEGNPSEVIGDEQVVEAYLGKESQTLG
jgi:branched-chain amino acid transport system ATP-binding protein